MIDAFILGAGQVLYLVIVLFCLRDLRDQQTGWIVISLVLSSAVFLCWLIIPEHQIPESIRSFVIMAARWPIFFIWLFGVSVFDDRFRFGWREVAVFIGWNAFWWTAWALGSGLGDLHPLANPSELLFALGLIAHVCWRMLAGWADDLLQRRRRDRLFVVGAIVLIATIDLVTELLGPWISVSPLFERIESILVVGVALLFVLWFLQSDGTALRHVSSGRVETPARMLSPRDQQLETQLNKALAERVYLQPDLSITALALQLGTSVPHLRKFINETSGFRNFRDFLNSHRLEVAKATLGADGGGDIPILTIAFDAGFASLASFNRVFKAAVGVTPSVYRTEGEPGVDVDVPRQNSA